MLTNISDQRLVPGRSEVGTILLALLAAGCADAGSLEPLTLDLNADSAPASLANALQLETGGSAAIEALRGPLTDADWVVRAWAVAILGRLGEQATELVGPATEDPHESVRVGAIAALHRISGSVSVTWLIRALVDDAARVRVRSLRALADVGVLTADHAPQLVALLGDTNHKARRWASIAAVSMGGSAVSALESALHDDVEHRWRAAWALGQIGPRAASALPRLRELAADADERVGTESRAAIAAIEPER